MYCSTCGNRVADHLNYCNSCGSRIESNALTVANASSRLFATAAGVIGVVGLICFVPLLQTLLGRGVDTAAMIVVLLAYLLTLLIMFSILVGHVWKHSGDIRIKTRDIDPDDRYSPPRSFRKVNTNQLEEAASIPVGSVTDQTTRTLDEVAVKRR
jgi:hypothetical protein